MKFIYLLLIILIVLIIIKIYKLFYEINCKSYIIHKKTLYSKIEPILKTGDLLLFNSYIHNPINRLFNNHIYSHIALIVKKNNILYSYEMLRGEYINKDKSEKNIVLLPLKERIKDYSGICYISRLKKPLTNEQINIINDYVEKINYKYMSIFEIIVGNIFNYNLTKNKVCSGIIFDILKKIKLIDNTKYIISCKEFIEILKLIKKKIYNDPIQIIHDDAFITDNFDNIFNDNYCTSI